MQRGGLAVRGDAEKAELALRAQPLEGWDDLVEHGLRGEIGAPRRADDRVVELEQINRVALHPLEASLERGGDRLADLAALGRRQPHLGADIAIGLQRPQDTPEIALGLAVAIHLRRVEIIDAEFDRPPHRALLIGGFALDHQPADRAAAEAEQRYVETGPAEFALFHRRLRCAACLLVLLGARLLDNPIGRGPFCAVQTSRRPEMITMPAADPEGPRGAQRDGPSQPGAHRLRSGAPSGVGARREGAGRAPSSGRR